MPHLLVAVGKEGYVYLLNRDNLGGVGEGPNGGDAVVSRLGPFGGVWSSPAVWGGDGGWIYIVTGSGNSRYDGPPGRLYAYQYGTDASGHATIAQAGAATDGFGFGSGAPVVTSNGTSSGSALVWSIYSPNGSGANAELRAYDPVPQTDGTMSLRYRAPVGTASKFASPGVGNNRIYVGTRDGHIVGFGAPVSATLTGQSLNFGGTVVGQTSTLSAVLTASAPVTVTAASLTGQGYSAGQAAPPLPANLSAGQSLSIPVTFAPTAPGARIGTLSVVSGSGQTDLQLSGTGLANSPLLAVSTNGLSMGGTATGKQLSASLTVTNLGDQTLHITNVVQPSSPFTLTNAPQLGQTMAPNSSFSQTVTFSPLQPGQYTSAMQIDSDGGSQRITITAVATSPAALKISTSTVSFGTIGLGTSGTQTFTLSNAGGSALTITKSKPPALGSFVADTTLSEGTTLSAGSSVTESVSFIPSASGAQSDNWFITADDGSGPQAVSFAGTGTGSATVLPPVTGQGWTTNGSASLSGSSLQLTPPAAYQAGSAFWPTAASTNALTVSYDATVDGGTGADGLALVLADSAKTSANALGAYGGGLGFAGTSGFAVALDEYHNQVNPSNNFVGISDGPTPTSNEQLHWLTTANLPSPIQGATTHVVAEIGGGQLTVWVNGTQALSQALTLPPRVLVGFTAGTGGLTNRQAVSNTLIVAATPPGGYAPVTPTRICDTRAVGQGVVANQCNHSGASANTLGAGETREVQISGYSGIPSTATAAVMNVTVADTSASSFLTVWATGSGKPVASNLNWMSGQTVSNLVEVPLSTNGKVSVFNAGGAADVIVDVEGYVGPSSPNTGLFNPLSPARICDTRRAQGDIPANQCDGNGAGPGTLSSGGTLAVQVTGYGGVPPTGVSAVVLNVTVADTTTASYLTVWPAGQSQPTASNLNWATNQIVPNRVIVPVGTGGRISAFNAGGNADVIIDVVGWFTDSSDPAATGALYTPLAPTRICDTRLPQPDILPNPCNFSGVASGALGPGGQMTVPVKGQGGVPSTATAAVLNVTVTGTTAPSFLTVWPSSTTRPLASDLNWTAGVTRPNLTVVKLGPDGNVAFFNQAGQTDVVVDVVGFYS